MKPKKRPEFCSYREAKDSIAEFAVSLGLEDEGITYTIYRRNFKALGLPIKPMEVWPDDFEGWGIYLGRKENFPIKQKPALRKPHTLSPRKAQKYVKTLNLTNMHRYRMWYQKNRFRELSKKINGHVLTIGDLLPERPSKYWKLGSVKNQKLWLRGQLF